MTDVARAAGVSLATVDRVLNGRGGVAPGKANRILSEARRLGLDRALRQRPSRLLRVAVLIQPPSNTFHAALAEGIALASRLHADLNMQFHLRHVDPNQPDRIATAIREEAARRDGMIVTAPNNPRIAAALRKVSAHLPVVTLADDLATSGRHAFVGPDDRRAGRVAGEIIGRFLHPKGGRLVVIVGRRDMVGHSEREAGCRQVLAEHYSETVLTDVLESGEDPDRAGALVHHALRTDPDIRAIYHTTAGARAIVDVLRRLGRARDIIFVTHELTEHRRALLRARAIDAVIDQDPVREAELAVETMARLLGRLEGEAVTILTNFHIYLAENA